MSMDFSGSAGAASSFDLIPENQVAFAVLTVRGVKPSQSGGGYIDCELTIDQGQPFAGRKVWDMIGDPQCAGNSEAYRQMGTIAITRILEAGRGAGPNNLPGYQIDNYEQLSGLRVAIKLGIETGSGGHDDKNRVKEYLTPNPASQSGHKGWLQLEQGVFNAKAKAAPAASGFGATASAGGGFGNANQGGGGAASSGFTQSQSGGSAKAATSPESSTQTGSAPSAMTSPSDPSATPGWLAQAGAQNS